MTGDGPGRGSACSWSTITPWCATACAARSAPNPTSRPSARPGPSPAPPTSWARFSPMSSSSTTRCPDGRGAHALEDVVAQHPGVAVVLITATPSLGVARAAVAHGAAGVVTKTRGVEPVLVAVRAAARGDLAVAPDLLRRLLGGASAAAPSVGRADVDVDLLSLLARGSSVADAARARDLSVVEARRRVAVAAVELGGRSTLETVSRAVAEGLLVSP